MLGLSFMLSKKLLASVLGVGMALGTMPSVLANCDEVDEVSGEVLVYRPVALRVDGLSAGADSKKMSDVDEYVAGLRGVFSSPDMLSIMDDPDVVSCVGWLNLFDVSTLEGCHELELESLADDVDSKLKGLYLTNSRFRDACKAIGFNPFSRYVIKRADSTR